VASIGYSAPPDTEVSFVTSAGEAKRLKFDAKGHYTTSKEDEIAALDSCAELESHPIGFAPKSKER
jgi:hypothetical protein